MDKVLKYVIEAFADTKVISCWRVLYQKVYKISRQVSDNVDFEQLKTLTRECIMKGVDVGYFKVVKHQQIIFMPLAVETAIYVIRYGKCYFYSFPAVLSEEFMPLLRQVTSWEGNKVTVPTDIAEKFSILAGCTNMFGDGFIIENTGNLCFHGSQLNVKTDKIICLENEDPVTVVKPELQENETERQFTFDTKVKLEDTPQLPVIPQIPSVSSGFSFPVMRQVVLLEQVIPPQCLSTTSPPRYTQQENETFPPEYISQPPSPQRCSPQAPRRRLFSSELSHQTYSETTPLLPNLISLDEDNFSDEDLEIVT